MFNWLRRVLCRHRERDYTIRNGKVYWECPDCGKVWCETEGKDQT